jgi:hypothetical protein
LIRRFFRNVNDDKEVLEIIFQHCVLITVVNQENLIAPRRQARKERPLFIFTNLGALCAFAARPWNISSSQQLGVDRAGIPQGETHFSDFFFTDKL